MVAIHKSFFFLQFSHNYFSYFNLTIIEDTNSFDDKIRFWKVNVLVTVRILVTNKELIPYTQNGFTGLGINNLENKLNKRAIKMKFLFIKKLNFY